MKCSRSTGIRILHVITGTSVGGAERMLQKILAALDKTAFESRVVSLTTKGRVGEELVADGVIVLPLNATCYPGIVAMFPKLIAEVWRFRPHIIQGWMYHGNIAATCAARFFHPVPPVIWNVRHSVEDMKIEKPATRFVIKGAAPVSFNVARVIFNAGASARQHHALGYDAGRSRVIPNGFDCSVFRPDEEARQSVRSELGVREDEILIGLVARYHPQKDHKTFLRAAAALRSVHHHIRFILVGRNVTETNSTLWDLIRQLNLQKAAILLGERKDVQRLMSSLDIFSLTSKTEGFPNTLGEAMSCGVPCVATDVGDAKWIVGPYGRIVPDSDPAAVANAWLQLISAGSAQRKALGLAARNHVTRNFSIESIAAQYAALYEESFQQSGRKDLH